MKKHDELEIISLNDKLFNEFSIEELEARLETDPLFLTTLVSGSVSVEINDNNGFLNLAAPAECTYSPTFCFTCTLY